MGKIIDRISGLDTGKYRVEETKDDQKQRQNQENQYSPDKEKDQFDKKGTGGAWKKLLPESRQSIRTGTFRNKSDISLNRVEVSEVSHIVRKPHWSHTVLLALGIMTNKPGSGKGKIRTSLAVLYAVLTAMIGTISIFILRLFLF